MNLSINSLNNIENIKPQNQTPISPGEAHTKFANVLKSAIERTNELQHVSDQKTEQLAKGGNVDLHEVMIAAQKASITLETAVQIQQKTIDAYNEIMRMQI